MGKVPGLEQYNLWFQKGYHGLNELNKHCRNVLGHVLGRKN